MKKKQAFIHNKESHSNAKINVILFKCLISYDFAACYKVKSVDFTKVKKATVVLDDSKRCISLDYHDTTRGKRTAKNSFSTPVSEEKSR